ncbi:MAG: Na-K-Cl cotransporter [Methanomicrobia archaeon]|nr:Na-K-Cl cotransporter [Methanomicrobia archaeon]
MPRNTEIAREGDQVDIHKFGTVKGVFVPTLLTILGVIMYLRLGWVVGNVGLLGAWIIILLAFIITTTTALSMASIISNIQIGPGGAYSIISRSLGLEIGGSIGVPLYFSLAFSVVLYIFGFREGLRFLFPAFPPLLIDLLVFGTVAVIIFFSTDVAFRIQYLILGLIAASLISIFAAGMVMAPDFAIHLPPENVSFWTVFAVFFPAATGIMAGANMSGELKTPRKSITTGTLWAIGIGLVIYLLLAFWLAGAADGSTLVSNFLVLLEVSYIGWVVVVGLLAATFSSAINSFVGASRVLHAMGEHRVVPRGAWFSRRAASGIPRNAVLFTVLIVGLSLLLRDINAIAPLITLFFLITYGMMNLVVLLESNLGLISFRPLFKIPWIIPLTGTVGSFFVMFIINPTFSLIAVILVVGFYYLLMYRHIEYRSPYGDVRSSLFVSIAEWAAKKSMELPASQERAWRPNLLVPADSPAELRGVSEFVRDITYPRGSVSILGFERGEDGSMEQELSLISDEFKTDGIFARWTIVHGDRYPETVISSIQTLKSAFFKPNIVFLRIRKDPEYDTDLLRILNETTKHQNGILLYAGHPRAGLGRRRSINLWIGEDCQRWIPGTPQLPNCDLAILIAYKLLVNWGAELRIIAAAGEDANVLEVEQTIGAILDYARIPVHSVTVVARNVESYAKEAEHADLNVFSLSPSVDIEQLRRLVQDTRSTCLFCRDSALESALV